MKQMKRATLWLGGLLSTAIALGIGCFQTSTDTPPCNVDADCLAGKSCSQQKVCTPRPCNADEDCGVSNECMTNHCSNRLCNATVYKSEDTELDDPTPGDCKRPRCDGKGNKNDASSDMEDVPFNDPNGCIVAKCGANGIVQVSRGKGEPCDAGACDGEGHCVQCVDDTTCGSSHCLVKTYSCVECTDKGHCTTAKPNCDADTHTCVSCSDGVKNGGESGVDCGSVCPKACNGEPCNINDDCQFPSCNMNVCGFLGGVACNGDEQCASLTCMNGLCTAL